MINFETFDTAWCPGCGNFGILTALSKALEELGKEHHEVVIAAGIGQAAKTPQYISTNAFCGLHGRSLPAAVAAKMANKDLTVIVNTGDGDSYGEGGNHFLHNVRRNVDITHFVHDNQIYGLTTGQASPTTAVGQKAPGQAGGTSQNEPLNPLFLAIASGAGFVARAYSADNDHLIKIMKEAIEYPGYALVDIFQPCVSFNKVNTYQYYKERVYHLDDSYDPSDKLKAIEKVLEGDDKLPIGVIYRHEKPTFHEKNEVLSGDRALIDIPVDPRMIEKLIQEFI